MSESLLARSALTVLSLVEEYAMRAVFHRVDLLSDLCLRIAIPSSVRQKNSEKAFSGVLSYPTSKHGFCLGPRDLK